MGMPRALAAVGAAGLCDSLLILAGAHAILDTVGVLGAAIVAQQAEQRVVFASGTLTASWVWFLILALAASLLRRFLTPRRRRWIDRGSGVILLLFAGLLAVEFINEFH